MLYGYLVKWNVRENVWISEEQNTYANFSSQMLNFDRWRPTAKGHDLQDGDCVYRC